eukprot:12111336-Karenia_brevis.AAC.1
MEDMASQPRQAQSSARIDFDERLTGSSWIDFDPIEMMSDKDLDCDPGASGSADGKTKSKGK